MAANFLLLKSQYPFTKAPNRLLVYHLSSAAKSLLIQMAQMLLKYLWYIRIVLVYILLNAGSLVFQYCSTCKHLQDSLLKVHSCFDGELQNHIILWVGRDLTRSFRSNPSALERDTFH